MTTCLTSICHNLCSGNVDILSEVSALVHTNACHHNLQTYLTNNTCYISEVHVKIHIQHGHIVLEGVHL
jgi:hypothetical protein